MTQLESSAHSVETVERLVLACLRGYARGRFPDWLWVHDVPAFWAERPWTMEYLKDACANLAGRREVEIGGAPTVVRLPRQAALELIIDGRLTHEWAPRNPREVRETPRKALELLHDHARHAIGHNPRGAFETVISLTVAGTSLRDARRHAQLALRCTPLGKSWWWRGGPLDPVALLRMMTSFHEFPGTAEDLLATAAGVLTDAPR